MDTALLGDPAFWESPEPWVAGTFQGELPEIDALRSQVLFETSGSTGTPKWIALSKSALLLSAAAVNRHLEVTDDSMWGLALPEHHVGGFGVRARAFEAACGWARFPLRWEPRAFAAWLAKHGVTHTSLVPTQVHDLLKRKLRAPEALRAVVVGGGRLDERAGQAARDLGWLVLASYGMTEAGSQIATQPLSSLSQRYRPAPLPLLPIWRVETGEGGALRIAGPALFSGTLVPADGAWRFWAREEAWFQTADLAEVSDTGITPLGRADGVVKVLGELVSPEAIERELIALSAGHLADGQVAVAAVADARAGHVLVPVFTRNADLGAVGKVLETYRAQALGFRRLEPPVIVTEFPLSPLGKLRRGELARRLAGGRG